MNINELWYKNVILNLNSTIVEIGALTGNISKFAYDNYGVKNIWAIEASPKNYNILSENIKGTSIIPVNAFIGLDGFVDFYEYSENISSNSIFGNIKTTETNMIKIKSTSLVSFCLEFDISKIDLLLMNCEGAELYILPQIINDEQLLNKIENISIEFHPKLIGIRNIRYLVNLLYPYFEYAVITKGRLGVDNAIFRKRLNRSKLPSKYIFNYYISFILDLAMPITKFLYYKLYKNIFHLNK